MSGLMPLGGWQWKDTGEQVRLTQSRPQPTAAGEYILLSLNNAITAVTHEFC